MRSRIMAMCAACLMLACAGTKRRAARPTGDGAIPLRVWIEDSPNLPADDLVTACNAWSAKSVRCLRAIDRRRSDIRVYDEPEADCEPKEEGGRTTLATAYHGGRIVMRTPCMRRWWRLNTLSTKELSTVFIHEVGHQIGIWKHVPKSCDAIDPKREVMRMHPSGRPICGRAIMNPTYDSGVTDLTPVDLMAFDVRRTDQAVVSDTSAPKDPAPKDGDPLCDYRRE